MNTSNWEGANGSLRRPPSEDLKTADVHNGIHQNCEAEVQSKNENDLDWADLMFVPHFELYRFDVDDFKNQCRCTISSVKSGYPVSKLQQQIRHCCPDKSVKESIPLQWILV